MRSTRPLALLAALATLGLVAGCKNEMSDPGAHDPTDAEKAAKAQRGGSLRSADSGAPPPAQVKRAAAPMTFRRP